MDSSWIELMMEIPTDVAAIATKASSMVGTMDIMNEYTVNILSTTSIVTTSSSEATTSLDVQAIANAAAEEAKSSFERLKATLTERNKAIFERNYGNEFERLGAKNAELLVSRGWSQC